MSVRPLLSILKKLARWHPMQKKYSRLKFQDQNYYARKILNLGPKRTDKKWNLGLNRTSTVRDLSLSRFPGKSCLLSVCPAGPDETELSGLSLSWRLRTRTIKNLKVKTWPDREKFHHLGRDRTRTEKKFKITDRFGSTKRWIKDLFIPFSPRYVNLWLGG